MPVESTISFEGGGGGDFGSVAVLNIANRTSRRIFEPFEFTRGRPGLAADVDASAFGSQAVIRAYTLAQASRWLLAGTNAAQSLATLSTGVGLTLTTAGASNDQMIISPLVINSAFQAGLGATHWRPDSGVVFRVLLSMGASIADMRFIAGLKLTASCEDHDSGTTPTDANYALFVYDTTHIASSGLWQFAVGNTAVHEHGIANSLVLDSTVRASNRVLLEIALNGNRQAVFAINGNPVGQSSAMVSGDVSLIPVFGLQALGAAAKAVTLEEGDLSMGLS